MLFFTSPVIFTGFTFAAVMEWSGWCGDGKYRHKRCAAAVASVRMTDPDRDDLELASNYAWNWFSLHAGQRMQVVNFFILSSSFITTAYVTAMQKCLFAVAGFVGIGGAAMALAVFVFERRTHDLVAVGRIALKELEKVLATRCGIDSVALVHKTPGATLTAPKYRHTISFLTLTATCLFAVSAWYSFSR